MTPAPHHRAHRKPLAGEDPHRMSPLTTLEMAAISGALRKAINTLKQHPDDPKLNDLHNRLTALRIELNAHHYGDNGADNAP